MDFDKFRATYPKHLVCGSHTDLVIEGYPRSANTFVVDMLKVICDRSGQATPRIAHHTHKTENIELGISFKIPVILLIRDPKDAIASFLIYSGAPLDRVVDRYCQFYEYVNRLEYPAHVLPFDTVVSDFDAVIETVNGLIETRLPKSIPEDVLAARNRAAERGKQRGLSPDELSRRISTPNETRREMKSKIIDQVVERLEDDKRPIELYDAVIAGSPFTRVIKSSPS